MFDLFDRLFPDDDPKSRKKWRATVGNTLLFLFLVASFTISAMLFDLPRLGSLAWAGDVERKIGAAIKPIEEKLATVESAVNQTALTTRLLLARLASDQIDQLVRRRCRSVDSDEIVYLSREIRRYQDDYRMNRGDVYVTPTCEEVGFKEAVARQ